MFTFSSDKKRLVIAAGIVVAFIMVFLNIYLDHHTPWLPFGDKEQIQYLYITNLIIITVVFGYTIFKYWIDTNTLEDNLVYARQQADLGRTQSDELLLNILPQKIASELKLYGVAKPIRHESVSILFTDFVGFTKIAENLEAEELVAELDRCFSYFDSVMRKYNLEKLKTIGDAYMAAGGIPESNSTHPVDCAMAALEIREFMLQMKELKKSRRLPYWELRIGIHTGSLVAGVVGETKFVYDVWGETVNIASRMEASGIPGAINISETTRAYLEPYFICRSRGLVSAKNMGRLKMNILDKIRPEYSREKAGRVPNPAFLREYVRLRRHARKNKKFSE